MIESNSMQQKLIVILGTNASGKSAVGIKLAQKYNAEIISADSRQIYRGFDLCSGKVTKEEATIVPHHMIDIVDVGTQFSVADYQERVYGLIPGIISRKRVPFIVGGTGLYIDAVTQGYILHHEEENSDFINRLSGLSIESLWSMLTPQGKEYLSGNPSDFNNKRRVIRVLEKEHKGLSLYPENAPRFKALQIGITWPKEKLHERIMERLVMRIKEGMIDEVGQYLKNGGNEKYLESLGLEYKHLLWLFQGKYSTVDEFTEGMAQAIRHFAKKQITWFKRNKSIVWLDMSGDYMREASILIDEFLSGGDKL